VPTDSVDNLETEHNGLTIGEFWSILITFSTMTSLCRHLSLDSTRNCKLSRDCRRGRSHRRHDATRLRCPDSRLVETVANWLQIPYTPPTQLSLTVESRRRRRCVLGFTFHPTHANAPRLSLPVCLCSSCAHFCTAGSETYKHGDLHSRPGAVAALGVCSR